MSERVNRIPGESLCHRLVSVSVESCPGRKVREDEVSHEALDARGARHSGAANIFLPGHTETLLQAQESFPWVILSYF